MHSRETMVAMASFLLSERERHQEDIDMINQKLEALARKGIYPEGTAPWISQEEIDEWGMEIIKKRSDHGISTDR